MHRIFYGGWGRAEPALGYCLGWLPPLVLSPLAGRLKDRFGPQVLVPVGEVLLAAGPALTGRTRARAVLPGARRGAPRLSVVDDHPHPKGQHDYERYFLS
jgi:hypothetical protein